MTIAKFETLISDFFGSPYAVAVDCCTHGIELCLRLLQVKDLIIPSHTYLSIPMTAIKLGIPFQWNKNSGWSQWYRLGSTRIIDSATLWKPNSYMPFSFMVLSFQHKKHLSLGRGGMILTDDLSASTELRKMRYDGRLDDLPWAGQNVETLGYHYYMTPETAEQGIEKFIKVRDLQPKIWSWNDYPDLSEMKVFENVK